MKIIKNRDSSLQELTFSFLQDPRLLNAFFGLALAALFSWSSTARAGLERERTLRRQFQEMAMGTVQGVLSETRLGVCELRALQVLNTRPTKFLQTFAPAPTISFEILGPTGEILRQFSSQIHWTLPARAVRQVRQTPSHTEWFERVESDEFPQMILGHDSSGQTRYLSIRSDQGERLEVDRAQPESFTAAGISQCLEGLSQNVD